MAIDSRATQGDGTGHHLRVMMHAQHLSGVGHFVRSLEIARALAEKHAVALTDGGRPIPRAWPAGVARLELPRIHRIGDSLAALDGTSAIEKCMAARRRALVEAAASLRPDALTVEHYPFSKWELDEELAALIAAARAANSALKVICSVRDIPRQTRHEACSPQEYAAAVLRRLHAQFDAVLVHGDAALTSLAEHFPAAADIRMPVHYTGWVSEKTAPSTEIRDEIRRITANRPYVLASVGGGRDAAGLLRQCLKAWHRLREVNALPDHVLVIFTGLAGASAELELEARHDGSVHLLPFTPGFLDWMRHARLSISCAGYNTCANLLESRCPALLIPNPEMSDQGLRAALLARLGAAHVLAANGLAPEKLADAMLGSIARSPARPILDLDGAIRSRESIEHIIQDVHHQAETGPART